MTARVPTAKEFEELVARVERLERIVSGQEDEDDFFVDEPEPGQHPFFDTDSDR